MDGNFECIFYTFIRLPPPQAFQKMVGNERKGLRTNFPKWREPQTKLYLIYHFTRTILLLKSLTTSDIDRFSYPQYT